MQPEVYFLKYAFPCAEVLKDLGKITQDDVDKVRDAAFNQVALPSEYLMKIFSAAAKRLQKVYPLKDGFWDIPTIRKYFQEEHNQIIDRREGEYAYLGPTIKELCKVVMAKVIRKEGDVLIVEYGEDRKRRVVSALYDDPLLGDLVFIHYGFAVEKASS